MLQHDSIQDIKEKCDIIDEMLNYSFCTMHQFYRNLNSDKLAMGMFGANMFSRKLFTLVVAP